MPSVPPERAGARSPPCPKSRRAGARYARRSSVTPDKLLARIVAHKPNTGSVVGASSWALKILHRRACRAALFAFVRKEGGASLQKAAECAESVAAREKKAASMATPVVAPRVGTPGD